jgi:hypothetical protein
MPIVNTARQVVTTASLPPTMSLTRAGSSDSATKPTSQNHDTMCAPPHSRRSVFNSRASVDTQGLRLITRSGAAGPEEGMLRANSQDETASARITHTTSSGLLAWETAMPPAIVPMRMARKVAPSTSALPAGSSAVASFSGRMPYLTGPNSDATIPNRPSATNGTGTECR